MAGLARARGEGRIGGASAKLPERILEFGRKLGTKPGARASGMSVAGFIKAVKQRRRRNWVSEQNHQQSAPQVDMPRCAVAQTFCRYCGKTEWEIGVSGGQEIGFCNGLDLSPGIPKP